jgi:hypothetical protein
MTVVQAFYPKRILTSTTGNLLAGISRTLEEGSTNILIDFKDVMFINSTGLSAIVLLLKQVSAANVVWRSADSTGRHTWCLSIAAWIRCLTFTTP